MNCIQSLLVVIIATLGSATGMAQNTTTTDFIPEGYFVYEKIMGDLNNDGIEDCILLIKGTDEKNVIIDRFDMISDRNRRGILVLFHKDDIYQLAMKNYDCFESENEDGGAYYPPQLSLSVDSGKLFINYEHGRYGYWHYTFRYANSHFELIGFDATSTYGPVTQTITSINFLTKKKLTRENLNQHEDGNDEDFKDTWEKIKSKELIKLSEIEDFSNLNMYD